jgi:hypothetical protein
MGGWVRYRFQTKSVDDPRPLVFDPRYPWWCTGYDGDGSYATVVAYLPAGEPLERYWDDASEVDADECDEPTFSGRFPRPEWLVEQ